MQLGRCCGPPSVWVPERCRHSLTRASPTRVAPPPTWSPLGHLQGWTEWDPLMEAVHLARRRMMMTRQARLRWPAPSRRLRHGVAVAAQRRAAAPAPRVGIAGACASSRARGRRTAHSDDRRGKGKSGDRPQHNTKLNPADPIKPPLWGGVVLPAAVGSRALPHTSRSYTSLPFSRGPCACQTGSRS